MDCCKKEEKKNKGILNGILYGLTAHSFCILFILLTVLGATTLTTILRPLFMSRYFFHVLILIAVIFATVSALLYLKRNNKLSLLGIKEKKNYLFILYGTTIAINLSLFLFIFPITANISGGASLKEAVKTSFGKETSIILGEDEKLLTVKVDIPCSGHAYLVFVDLDGFPGVKNVDFRFPNIFDISYDSDITTPEEIFSVDVFQNYKTVVE
jgi:hypothetical protein